VSDKAPPNESRLPDLAELDFAPWPEGTKPHPPRFIDPRIVEAHFAPLMNLESAVRYQFFNRKAAEVAKERRALLVGRYEIWGTNGPAWFTQWVKWNHRLKSPAISRNINSSQRSLCVLCASAVKIFVSTADLRLKNPPSAAERWARKENASPFPGL